jgi:methionine-rich copper-binding protein CopC
MISQPTPDRRPSATRPSAQSGARVAVAPRSAAPATRLIAVLAAALLALAAIVLTAPHASAHNSLQGTDPADGSTVATAPERVTLTFDEAAQALGTEIVVLAPDGSTVSDGAPELGDVTVTQALAGTLPAGTYTVQYRVTSADGHPISGTFTFTASADITIGQANPGAPATPDSGTATEEPEPTVTPEVTTLSPASPEASPSTVAEETAQDEGSGLAAGASVAWVVAVLAAGAVAVFVVRERRRAGDRTED